MVKCRTFVSWTKSVLSGGGLATFWALRSICWMDGKQSIEVVQPGVGIRSCSVGWRGPRGHIATLKHGMACTRCLKIWSTLRLPKTWRMLSTTSPLTCEVCIYNWHSGIKFCMQGYMGSISGLELNLSSTVCIMCFFSFSQASLRLQFLLSPMQCVYVLFVVVSQNYRKINLLFIWL